MTINLYGEKILSYRDVARKIVTLGVHKPFYQVHIDDTNMITYTVGNEKAGLNFPGFYVIYRKVDNKLEALYTGYSDSAINARVYRFIKELQDRSRPDESHYAAKKARYHGIKSTDMFLIKALPKSDIPKFDNFHYDMTKVDECIAHLLKSRFNERRIYD